MSIHLVGGGSIHRAIYDRFAVPTLILALLTACGPRERQAQTEPPLPSITLPAELDRVLRAYERAWQAGSTDGLAGLFTEDGYVLQPGRPPVRGRAAIAQAYQGHGGPLALRALAYATSDTVGYIVGAYAATPDAADDGKFILLLRRAAHGEWQIAADMDNGNRPR